MSWIIGFVGKSLSRGMRERLAAFGTDRRVETIGRTYYVACGGIPETCLHGKLPDGHWAVLGTGIQIDGGAARMLPPATWRKRLSSHRPRLARLGGGFVALRWSTRRIEAFSDVFGLRTLYWLRRKDGFLVSTRPEWLTELAGGLSVDWKAFGSHWLAYHQLSPGSLVEGLERLPPNGYVHLTDESAEAAGKPYAPSAPDEHVGTLLTALEQPEDDRTVSLGLSGGLDSRVLLAVRPSSERFAAHVFGPRTRRDVQVALRIADSVGIPYSHIHGPPPEGDELLETVRRHAVRAQAVSPASAALSLGRFPELRAQNKIVIDGGFGEILRRQFMNRLLRRTGRAVAGGDAATALEHVSFSRASVFLDEYVREMQFGARRDLAEQLDAAADLKDRSLEDRVDILNVWTRLPNFFGYEQARMDGLVQSYMPFAHPKVVDAALAVPTDRRKHSRAARRLIAQHENCRRRFPLVKGGQTYPYAFPPVVGTVYAKAKARLTRAQASDDRQYVLQALEPFIRDRIRSGRHLYDTAALERLTKSYYADGRGGEQLDWWLAFELWREAIERRT